MPVQMSLAQREAKFINDLQQCKKECFEYLEKTLSNKWDEEIISKTAKLEKRADILATEGAEIRKLRKKLQKYNPHYRNIMRMHVQIKEKERGKESPEAKA